jgi:hypothetical protein
VYDADLDVSYKTICRIREEIRINWKVDHEVVANIQCNRAVDVLRVFGNHQ